MLTETVAGRTYDYSHNVGRQAQTGMGFNVPVDLALGTEGVTYVVNRGSETISKRSLEPHRCGAAGQHIDPGQPGRRGRVPWGVQQIRQRRRSAYLAGGN